MASSKTEEQPVNPAAGVWGPDASAPNLSDNAPESKDDQEEVDCHSVYVHDLPLNVTIAQLEDEFKKFGTIKQNGVLVRSNKQQGFCFTFVEFQDLSSMQTAIKASPITIGDYESAVEIKRKTSKEIEQEGGETPRLICLQYQVAAGGVVLLLRVVAFTMSASRVVITLTVVRPMWEMIASEAEEASAVGEVEKVINKEEEGVTVVQAQVRIPHQHKM